MLCKSIWRDSDRFVQDYRWCQLVCLVDTFFLIFSLWLWVIHWLLAHLFLFPCFVSIFNFPILLPCFLLLLSYFPSLASLFFLFFFTPYFPSLRGVRDVVRQFFICSKRLIKIYIYIPQAEESSESYDYTGRR